MIAGRIQRLELIDQRRVSVQKQLDKLELDHCRLIGVNRASRRLDC
jgi:hypothetical protein